MVTLGYPRHAGDSTAPFIDALARALTARGHTIDVVLPHHPSFSRNDVPGVRFYPYRYSPIPAFSPWGYGQTFDSRARVRVGVAASLPAIAASLQRALRRRLAHEQYDVVHAHWVVPNGWFAARASKAYRVPLVITLHGSDVALAERHRVLRQVARGAFRTADQVTASSRDLVERALKLGARETDSHTLYLGVDTNVFKPSAPSAEVRARLDAPGDAFLAVSIGRLAEVKGFAYLIDAARQLKDVAVAIVGDGELRDELRRRAAGLGAVKLVGSLPHDLIPAVLAVADTVVVPSVVDRAGRVDGLPNTVLEALASGRPLVATRVGGIPEVVRDGENGLLVPQKDAEALARALRQLQGDEALRARLSAGARQSAVERFSWAATAEDLEVVYSTAIARRAAL